jgi:uncharacterized protein YyaL (SSP411 family)
MPRWRQRLFLEREKRIPPGLDDKVLLDWNALMCSAYCHAYRATGREEYKDTAVRNMGFLYAVMKNDQGFHHSYKDGESKHDAFLNDYAYLIETLVELYGITFEECYLHEAKSLVDLVIGRFFDPASKLFHFTQAGQADVIVRKKEVYDNAMPSGNATMAHNLCRLGVIFGEESYGRMAEEMLLVMSESVERYPRSFSKWALATLMQSFPLRETAVLGDGALDAAKDINKRFLPNKILMAALREKEGFPLLKDRYEDGRTTIYLCSGYECKRPVHSVPEYLDLLKK